jgi:hypothetical protein
MHLRISGAAALALAVGSCSSAPSPPVLPEEVLTLADRYDHPTATLDPLKVRAILDQTAAEGARVEPFAGLRFIRDIIGNASNGTAAQQDLSVEVRGSVAAHAPCPGDDAAPSGALDLVIGIERSRGQRALTGRASECRFVVTEAERNVSVVVTADVQIDVGGPFALDDPPPPSLLVRATHISGSIAGAPFSFPEDVVHFRLRADGGIETLLDLGPLGGSGSGVLELRKDGVVALRVSDGAWVCGAKTSGPCDLSR